MLYILLKHCDGDSLVAASPFRKILIAQWRGHPITLMPCWAQLCFMFPQCLVMNTGDTGCIHTSTFNKAGTLNSYYSTGSTAGGVLYAHKPPATQSFVHTQSIWPCSTTKFFKLHSNTHTVATEGRDDSYINTAVNYLLMIVDKEVGKSRHVDDNWESFSKSID